MSKKWAVGFNDQDTEVHVWPTNDDLEHELTDECICGPRPEFSPESLPMYTHASLDGREAHEPDGDRWNR